MPDRPLRVDMERYAALEEHRLLEVGIYVRALIEVDGAGEGASGWEDVDIMLLDRPSLMRWLRSRGGDNPWAEEVVARLLDHEPEAVDA